jgi:hypothetical protein
MRRFSLLLAAALLASPARAQDKPAGPTFEPYGFALLHAFFGDGSFENKDNAYHVIAPTASDSTGFYNFSVRGSRLGFRIGNLDTGYLGATGSFVLEYDVQGGFTGSATATTRWQAALMRLRLANGKLDWKTSYGNWQILAGQDFGLVGPVYANSITYGTDPVFVRAGKIYRRTPQIRATYSHAVDMFSFNLAAAVLAASESDGVANDFGPGNRSRVPDIEGRAMIGVKVDKDFFGTANVAYHTHKRRYNDATGQRDLTASILNVGLDASITEYAQVKGEYYKNEGAEDSYLGLLGPKVGTTLATLTLLKSTGYWAQLTLKPIPALWLAGGYGKAEADSASKALLAANTWFANTQIHFALISNVSKNLALSAEYVMVESSHTPATAAGTDAKYKANEFSISTRFGF